MFDHEMLESLESRRLLSVGASVFAGTLRVYGDLVNDNQITVGKDADGASTDVTIRYTTPQHVSKTFTANFPSTRKFTRVNISGGLRADTITIDETNGPLGVRVRIDSFRGDDTINAGVENDLIYAGLGKDTVNGGGGNDLVYGGGGDDSLTTGSGNDTVWGGNGNDFINTGDGDDKLGGVLGNNTLLGGAGHDTFVVKALSDNPTNDYNSSEDTLVTTDTSGDVDQPPGTQT